MRLSLNSTHDELPTAHVRVVQVLATAWLFTGQSLLWPTPPLAVLSTVLCLALLFSPFTRACALGLALLICLQVEISPTWFAHNRLFVASLLVMVSFTSRRFTRLPRVQVAFVYAVAAVDKLLEPAWRDGRFFESFVAQLARFGLMWSPAGHVGAPNTLASWLESHGSHPLWMLVGIVVIAGELLLVLCFLARWRIGAWLNAAFHVSVFALTGSTMGQFFFAGAAASLLLVDEKELPRAWPVVLLTVALAGPWTHRFLPVALFLVLLLLRARRR